MTNIKKWFFKHITPIKLYGGAFLYFVVLVLLAVVPQTRVPSDNVALDI